MARKKENKFKLCVYLVKETCNSYEEIIENPSALTPYSIKNKEDNEIILYIKESRQYRPKWASFFDNCLEEGLSNIYNSSTSAVLIVNHNKRYFAFTFGYGRNLLKLDLLEETFGLIVALNSINHEKILSVDIKNIDTVLRQSKVQTSQAGSIDNFGMNINRDILNAVTGLSSDASFGKRIIGSVAFHLIVPTTIDGLQNLCGKLLQKYNDTSYKEYFPWVDHVREVKNTALKTQLNEELIKAIKTKNESLYLAAPELVDWELVEGFKYKESDESELKEDIHILDVLPLDEEQIEEKVNLDWLKRKKVLCVGGDNDQVVNRWSLYNCINYEFRKNGDTFLLTSGRWFKIDTNYVNTVNEFLTTIDEYNKFQFPEYRERREDEYNTKVFETNKDNCILMDKKNIYHGGGRSQIEFCDLIINNTDFVHIKRFRGSSTLSHLFFQGFNSASLLLSDIDFLKKVNNHLPPHSHFDETGQIEPANYEIVFAIISEAEQKTVKDILPFFSKVAFLQIYNQLRAYKYKVSLAKIRMEK